MFKNNPEVAALSIGISDDTRTAVAGAGDIDHTDMIALNDPVEMDIDKVQARRRAPMPEQARLDVID